jgi:hypothetical protein
MMILVEDTLPTSLQSKRPYNQVIGGLFYFQMLLNMLRNVILANVLKNQLLQKPCLQTQYLHKYLLTPEGPKAIFRPFLKFGQAIVKAIFIKNP